jgi:hypothetical protein
MTLTRFFWCIQKKMTSGTSRFRFKRFMVVGPEDEQVNMKLSGELNGDNPQPFFCEGEGGVSGLSHVYTLNLILKRKVMALMPSFAT